MSPLPPLSALVLTTASKHHIRCCGNKAMLHLLCILYLRQGTLLPEDASQVVLQRGFSLQYSQTFIFFQSDHPPIHPPCVKFFEAAVPLVGRDLQIMASTKKSDILDIASIAFGEIFLIAIRIGPELKSPCCCKLGAELFTIAQYINGMERSEAKWLREHMPKLLKKLETKICGDVGLLHYLMRLSLALTLQTSSRHPTRTIHTSSTSHRPPGAQNDTIRPTALLKTVFVPWAPTTKKASRN